MCPACGEILVTFELEGIEADHCVACKGTWLDAGELEEIIDRSGGNTALVGEKVKAAGAAKPGKRSCVRCRAKLSGVTFGAIEFDRCPYGHGIWFDKGEMADAVKSSGGEVAAFLGKLFQSELKGA
jgi:Zn-finger nucleic acid-binding protein